MFDSISGCFLFFEHNENAAVGDSVTVFFTSSSHPFRHGTFAAENVAKSDAVHLAWNNAIPIIRFNELYRYFQQKVMNQRAMI